MLLPNVTLARVADVPDVLEVQFVPSGEVDIFPLFPVATNNPLPKVTLSNEAFVCVWVQSNPFDEVRISASPTMTKTPLP
jgi:hypothetical protein